MKCKTANSLSVFNLADQNSNLNNKIVAGLERLSQVFRILLWEHAKGSGLSPIQIQLLIFIGHHSASKTTVSYMAQEFNVTRPTISDSIKVLVQKELIERIVDEQDARSYHVELTKQGRKMVAATEHFTDPLSAMIGQVDEGDKIVLWRNISNLISQLNIIGVISVQRTCFHCKHYSSNERGHFCSLLSQPLGVADIRIDCAEFEHIPLQESVDK